MSEAACKFIRDNGNYNESAHSSALAAETLKELFLEAEGSMTDEGITASVAFAEKLCDWHEIMEKWKEEMHEWTELIYSGAYSKKKGKTGGGA